MVDSNTYISLAQYAKLHKRSPVSVRQMAARGGFQTAVKIGRNWIIDKSEPYPDRRYRKNTDGCGEGAA